MNEILNSYIMSAMRRRTSFILLFLLGFGTIIFFYINNIFIPIKLKQILTNKSQEYLHREVSLGNISFNFLNGFTISDIHVYRRDDPQKVFLSINEASFNIFYLPFGKKNKVIISGLEVKGPLVYILLDHKKEWNFSDLLQKKTGKKGKKQTDVYLTRLKVYNGDLIFLDNSQKEPYTEQLSNLKISASISTKKILQFFVGAQIPRKRSLVTLKGAYSIADKKLKAAVSANNLYISEYLDVFSKGLPLKFSKGILSFADGNISFSKKTNSMNFSGDYAVRDINLTTTNGINIKGKINAEKSIIAYNGKKIAAKGYITLSSGSVISPNGNKFHGNISLDVNSLIYDFKDLHTRGSFKINQGSFSFGADKTLTGDINAETVKLIMKGKSLSLYCDLDTKNTSLNVGNDILAKGDVIAKNTSISLNGKEFILEGKVDIKNADIKTKSERSFVGEISASSLTLSNKNKKLEVNAAAHISNTVINAGNNIKFEGNPDIKISYKYPEGKNNVTEYAGRISLHGSTLTGVKNFEQITGINGDINIKNNYLSTDKLDLSANNTDLQVTGSISNFKKPFADISLNSSSIDLDMVYKFFQDKLKKLGLKVTGSTSAKIQYKGLILYPKDAVISVAADLTGTDLHFENKNIDVTNISGKINYKNNLLAFNNIQGTFDKELYKIGGQLSDFSRPILNIDIFSEKLSASAHVKILNKAFGFTKLSGKYLNSSFNLKGDVRLVKDKNPILDIRGSLNIFTDDIFSFHSKILDKINFFDPKGYLSVQNFLFKGQLNDWRNWQLIFLAKMPSVAIKGYPFKNIEINYSQRDKNISKCEASSIFYNGELQVSSTADLTKKEIPFDGSVSLINLDLAEMRKDKKIKKSDIRGTLSLKADFKGSLTNPKALTGNGSFLTNKAYLGEIEIIKGLTSVINKIPGYIGNLVASLTNEAADTANSKTTNYISDLRGDFTIKNKRLYTNNTVILGSIYDLIVDGSIGFNKKLDLAITPDYSRFQNKEKRATEFIGTPVQIKITGSVDNPKYKPLINPVKPIEKAVGTTINLIKEVGNMFGDMIK